MTTREGKAQKFVSVPADYAGGIQEGDETPVLITNAGGGAGGTIQNANLSIQATDEGTVAGNARGATAVDLQTARVAATQVASGDYSAVVSGYANSASGDESVAVGGSRNGASGLSSAVIGGDSNTASGSNSAVIGGISNTASGISSATIGGNSNIAAGNRGVVVGGDDNIAAGDFSHASGRNMQIDAAADNTHAHGYSETAVPIIRPDSYYIYGLQPIFHLDQAAPADADLLENGSGSFWVDNGTNELRVKVRKEDGTVLNGVVATLT